MSYTKHYSYTKSTFIMESILPLIIQLASGALGGTAAGKLFQNLSMGTVLNAVLGILGGGLGGQILGMLGMGGEAAGAASSMDIGSILSSVAGGGVGGGALMAIGGLIKNMMNKK